VPTKRWSEVASSAVVAVQPSVEEGEKFAEFDGVGGVQTHVVSGHVQPSGL